MQVSIETTSGLERRLTVGVPAERVDNEVNTRLQKTAKSARINGFRPGKVPMGILRQRFGKSVMGEVLEQTVNETSQQALDDNDLRPAQQPKIEITKFDEGEDLEFTLEVEVMPEIEPMDFSKLKLEKLVSEVEEDKVAEALEQIAGQQKSFEKISSSRKSKSGDAVIIDFLGKVDGEAFDGGQADD